jgi:hypothetical protein
VHVNDTGNDAFPDIGVAVPDTVTVIGAAAVTVIAELLHCAVLDAKSVTVTVAVNVPPTLYAWPGFCDVLVPPSPKFHE